MKQFLTTENLHKSIIIVFAESQSKPCEDYVSESVYFVK